MPPRQPDTATLDDVEDDGGTLVLADGRRLQVSPDDSEAASIWMPGAKLTLGRSSARGRRRVFDLSVTNDETGETVAARLCS
jgi:hypothetical protein